MGNERPDPQAGGFSTERWVNSGQVWEPTECSSPCTPLSPPPRHSHRYWGYLCLPRSERSQRSPHSHPFTRCRFQSLIKWEGKPLPRLAIFERSFETAVNRKPSTVQMPSSLPFGLHPSSSCLIYLHSSGSATHLLINERETELLMIQEIHYLDDWGMQYKPLSLGLFFVQRADGTCNTNFKTTKTQEQVFQVFMEFIEGNTAILVSLDFWEELVPGQFSPLADM